MGQLGPGHLLLRGACACLLHQPPEQHTSRGGTSVSTATYMGLNRYTMIIILVGVFQPRVTVEIVQHGQRNQWHETSTAETGLLASMDTNSLARLNCKTAFQ